MAFRSRVFAGFWAAVLVFSGFAVATASAAADLAPETVNLAQFDGKAPPAGQQSPLILKVQVLLDRRHFSPGVIDGYPGENVRKALAAFQRTRGLEPTGRLDRRTWSMLIEGHEVPVLGTYTIAPDDVAGPYAKAIPADYGEKAKLKRMSYTGVQEMLAERFHMDVDLLAKLNEGADFSKAGTKILVAAPGEAKPRGTITRIVVDRTVGSLTAYDEQGGTIVFYPATVGSRQLPTPTGTHKIRAVALMPNYTYRPDVNFKQGENDKPLIIPPGPNGPVGSVWIDLSKPTYGIHGTPEPSKIDKTNSHGCVRLTNWDATELAHLVKSGLKVTFVN